MALVTVIPGTFTTPNLPTLGIKGFTDTFTRVNNTSIGVTEGMPVRPWSVSVQSGTSLHGIRNNEGYAARSTGSGHCVASVDAQASDGTFEVTLGANPAAAQVAAAFRVTTVDNWLGVVNVQGTAYWLRKMVAGTTSTIFQIPTIIPAPGDRIKVVLAGSSIAVYINDVLATTQTDTHNQAATRHGFYTNGDTQVTVRDVKFTAA